ncbi:ABC transporter permease [Allofranklinella schreckenbergeri]|uniref:ABC transporter permease n=1 Tax=Allofranklinella schreckenbergeri TaxID=1076744 RepID=A0A3M6Q5S1_9BURK|nr:ABC transporter permease [Allofranklinella schreckenbergeri]RMW96268.1 ABC transporter permease [Allofranklinella schreckenbergeri]RMW97748.1 ABC transporter permease [Allofranklinella schreckenbergeri]RMX09397.1 ABC transporter permease [Allofranklinella schreckenbergeri]
MSEWIYQALSLVLDQELLARYGARMATGLVVTIKLVALSYFLGMALAQLLALGRLSRIKPVQMFCRGYIYFFRGSPLLGQLFLLYYGLGSLREFWQEVGLWWFFRDAWYCSVLAFTLNTAAYQAEIFRGSLLAIPKGQFEAAQALGLSRFTTLRKVVLPQSMLVALGPLGNELILMIKASAIASLVTVYDVMGVARLAYSRTFDFEIYLWAAVLYLLMVEIIRRSLLAIEARLSRHIRP